MQIDNRVVLVDKDGNAVGTASKASVHTKETPLHLAFSCYLFDSDGRVLLTRRALAKRTWPGVWTNSFCGHPAPGEDMQSAIRRHARLELGIDIADVVEVLPTFRYSARDASGLLENEICPVFTARTVEAISANPAEVAEWVWVEPGSLVAAVAATPRVFSPWSVLQVRELNDVLQGASAADRLADRGDRNPAACRVAHLMWRDAVREALGEYANQRADAAGRYGPEFRHLWSVASQTMLGGKFIRPVLLVEVSLRVCACRNHTACEVDERTIVRAAAAVEMLHYSFVLHDDVIDGDIVRRGRPNLIGTVAAQHPTQATPATHRCSGRTPSRSHALGYQLRNPHG